MNRMKSHNYLIGKRFFVEEHNGDKYIIKIVRIQYGNDLRNSYGFWKVIKIFNNARVSLNHSGYNWYLTSLFKGNKPSHVKELIELHTEKELKNCIIMESL